MNGDPERPDTMTANALQRERDKTERMMAAVVAGRIRNGKGTLGTHLVQMSNRLVALELELKRRT